MQFVLLLLASLAVRAPADTGRVAHLLSRATYGARPADVALVSRIGIDKWLDDQLHPDRIDDRVLESRLTRFPTLKQPIRDLIEEYRPKKDGTRPQRVLLELIGAKLTRSAMSERQLEQVMTDFWFNHFNVFWADGPVRYMIADYEANAIRPHVFGKFSEMLEATARHPAMLLYLDNAMSNARRGLNENYARELMELHTLGVDGGYTQSDVVDVARAFTGWTVGRYSGFQFRFVPAAHDRGKKTVLGKQLPAGRGIEDGEDVLRMLAHHPSTAMFIARKLAVRFVADEPPQALVDRLAAVFRQTDGDLREVTRTLFTSPEFYDPKYRGVKVKTPFELVVSAMRLERKPVAPRKLLQTLRSLGEVPYMQSAPTGYSAKNDDWMNSGALLARINFGLSVGPEFGKPEFQMK